MLNSTGMKNIAPNILVNLPICKHITLVRNLVKTSRINFNGSTNFIIVSLPFYVGVFLNLNQSLSGKYSLLLEDDFQYIHAVRSALDEEIMDHSPLPSQLLTCSTNEMLAEIAPSCFRCFSYLQSTRPAQLPVNRYHQKVRINGADRVSLSDISCY